MGIATTFPSGAEKCLLGRMRNMRINEDLVVVGTGRSHEQERTPDVALFMRLVTFSH